ncbi:tRNA glutamyl-Q(34) synthetase GluQRS [Synechococcus sp. UW140]|uniref:tRNA glutamyl-Q(34) synthetase GluQRS n=1 Tax=Synechococcus sp. UW140 TaxID=368503 RepID=UPI003138243E
MAQACRSQRQRGRFAPTPSGPLHLGNLHTALLSWLFCRLQGGEWLLRIDNLDTPRVQAGAEAQIIADLAWLGLAWDPPIWRQSERRGLYASILSALRRSGALYPCRCSRRMLAHLSAPHGAWPLYPGTCLDKQHSWGEEQAKLPSWRLHLPATELEWQELGNYPNKLNGAEQVGDVVLRRADGYVAYHLATAVDELWMGINTVVRGSDLWVSTGPQVALMQMLGQTAPQYWHLPLLLDNQGNKLAKRDRALGVASWQAQGGSAAQLIGKWAAQNGWIAPGSSISTQELLEELKNKPKNFSLKALKQQLL